MTKEIKKQAVVYINSKDDEMIKYVINARASFTNCVSRSDIFREGIKLVYDAQRAKELI